MHNFDTQTSTQGRRQGHTHTQGPKAGRRNAARQQVCRPGWCPRRHGPKEQGVGQGLQHPDSFSDFKWVRAGPLKLGGVELVHEKALERGKGSGLRFSSRRLSLGPGGVAKTYAPGQTLHWPRSLGRLKARRLPLFVVEGGQLNARRGEPLLSSPTIASSCWHSWQRMAETTGRQYRHLATCFSLSRAARFLLILMWQSCMVWPKRSQWKEPDSNGELRRAAGDVP